MLILRRAQIVAFHEPMQRVRERGLQDYLRQRYAAECTTLDDTVLLAFVRAAVESAQAAGLHADASVFPFVTASFIEQFIAAPSNAVAASVPFISEAN